MFDDEPGEAPIVSKTIKINDCMKVSKKSGANNEQIAKLVKVKDHTKNWIKNIEKGSKGKNEYIHQCMTNLDYRLQMPNVVSGVHVATPTQFVPALHPSVTYLCSFCLQVPGSGSVVDVQYHESLSQPYVVLCSACRGADMG